MTQLFGKCCGNNNDGKYFSLFCSTFAATFHHLNPAKAKVEVSSRLTCLRYFHLDPYQTNNKGDCVYLSEVAHRLLSLSHF